MSEKIDHKIAAEVMGWRHVAEQPAPTRFVIDGKRGPKFIHRNPTAGACAAGYDPAMSTSYLSGHWASNAGFEENDDWSPSTDIAAAWRVLEQLMKTWRWVEVQSARHLVTGEKWRCAMNNDEFGCIHAGVGEAVQTAEYVGWGETAQLAICSAAMKFAGTNVP